MISCDAFLSSLLVSKFFPPSVARASSFAPGGTLVDYEVGIQVGNPDASPSRKVDNSNVPFNQDYYYKFGTAPAWDASPPQMPFTPSQQRYDAMKKYRDRVLRGVGLIADMRGTIEGGEMDSLLPADAPEYSIRPMGLLANALLASENTGTTNELLLARWYINEVYLDLQDVVNEAGSSKDAALISHKRLVRAVNS